MFRVTYRPKNDRDHSRTELFNDTKDLGQFILNLTDNEKEANSAMKWCSEASFGSKITRQPNYKIECFNEDALAKDIENKVVRKICDYLGIGYNFIGYDNDALTWDIGAGTSWIKYHEDYGYYIVINRVESDGTCNELFSTTNKSSQQFITDAVVGTEKAMKKQLKETKNVQTADNNWHKHYVSGGNKKIGPNDHIDYYYKNNGAKISVQYLDWRHNKAVAYAAYDASGKSLGCYSRLYEAQRVIDLGK